MTCQQAAEVISRSVDAPLPAGERVGLGVHILFCGPCRRFRQQLLRLHAACEQAASDDALVVGGGLSTEACGRIAAALDQAPPAG